MTTAKHDHDLRAAGCAALLELMDAARAWAANTSALAMTFDHRGARLVEVAERMDALLAELKPEPAHFWVPSTWGAVARCGPGTRVRLGGVEAVVETITSATWHVDPRSPARAPRALETTLVRVKLVGREQSYDFPTNNVVEFQDVVPASVTEQDWAADAMKAQEERAVRLLSEAFGPAVKVSQG